MTPFEPAVPPPADAPPAHSGRFGSDGRIAMGLLGILAILVEAFTHGTAEILYDPLPTVWHLPLSLLAPVLLIAVEWRLRRPSPPLRLLAAANGYAVAVGLCYFVAFVPTLPLMFFAIMFMGLGLLGFSPMLLTISALFQSAALRRRAGKEGGVLGAILLGAVAGALPLGALQAPMLIVSIGVSLAASPDPGRAAMGMDLLRRHADERELAQYLRHDGFRWAEQIEWSRRGPLFFRATGRDLWAASIDRWHDGFFHARQREFRGSASDDWELLELGAPVSARSLAWHLGLEGSAIDAAIAEDASVAYVEWTLTFANRANWQQEAIAQLALPPGAAGSRLTLWIDGEEREAAYAETAKVTEAYEQIAKVQRKDPALLTWLSPDRLALRAFPVPPNGEMKVKVGFTVPLLHRDGEALLPLPSFAERNFLVTPALEHHVWIESVPALSGPPSLSITTGKSGAHALRGALTSGQLQVLGARTLVKIKAPAALPSTTQAVPLKEGGALLLRFEPPATPRARQVVLVVDPSASMRGNQVQWAAALGALPPGSQLLAIVAEDELRELPGGFQAVSPSTIRAVAGFLEEIRYQGGHDPVPALTRAWNLAAAQPEGLVVWVHGPQPILMASPTELEQAAARSASGPRLLSLPVSVGPDRLLESALGRQGLIVPVPRLGDLTADLASALRWGGSGQPTWTATHVRELPVLASRAIDPVMGPEEAPAEALQLSGPHVGRLAVARWLEKLAQHGSAEERALAIREAVARRLITPFTGAVVLEKAEQYAQQGLTPATSDTVPSVPEPGTVALLLVAGGTAAVARYRRRRRTQATA